MTARTLLALVAFATSAYGQTVYLPIEYQYRVGERTFYYGGNDPWTLERGAFYGLRPLDNEPLRVFTDRLPNVNAARWGFTIDDARNDAYAAVPRHFRKSELSAPPPGERVETLPEKPGTIEIKPYVRPAGPPSRVLTLP
jgi:hypothetical protein